MKRKPIVDGSWRVVCHGFIWHEYRGLLHLPQVKVTMDGDTAEPCLAEDVYVPYGAVIGDICGSRYDGILQVSEDPQSIELIHSDCTFTANTVLTAAVADVIGTPQYPRKAGFQQAYREWMRKYPHKQYPDNLRQVVDLDLSATYSFPAIDASAWISPVSWMAKPDEEKVHRSIAEIGRDVDLSGGNREGPATMLFAFAYCGGGGSRRDREQFCLRQGMPTETLQELRVKRADNELQLTNTQLALRAFFESHDFKSAIQNAVSLGGDCATIAAITGSIAEAVYCKIPQELIDFAKSKLPEEIIMVIEGTDPRFTEYCTDEEAAEIKKELEERLEIERRKAEEIRQQEQAEYAAMMSACNERLAKKAANNAAAELATREAKRAAKLARKQAWEARQAEQAKQAAAESR
jgi:hypothetical protein